MSKRARTINDILADQAKLANEIKSIHTDIKLTPVESSNLDAVGYDGVNHRLRVQFHNGTLYDYANVPASIFNQLLVARSKGQFFNENVKDEYPATKVL